MLQSEAFSSMHLLYSVLSILSKHAQFLPYQTQQIHTYCRYERQSMLATNFRIQNKTFVMWTIFGVMFLSTVAIVFGALYYFSYLKCTTIQISNKKRKCLRILHVCYVSWKSTDTIEFPASPRREQNKR